MGPNRFFGVTFCHSAPLARLRGGMDTVQLGDKVQQLKAEVVELKADNEMLKAAVALTYADAKQTMEARLGPTIVVGLTLTEDEAKEMRAIAEETGRCGQSLVDLSVDIGGHCNPWSPTSIADSMEKDGNRLVTLASRLLQLWEPLRQVVATALAATALGQLIGAAGCCQSPAPPAQLITSWESIRLRVHIECHGITVR